MPHQHRSENTFIKETKQAFRDAKWIEPQQEGELVGCPLEKSCEAFKEQECDVCTVGQVRQAQLAHDKQRMVRVPSELSNEKEIVKWLRLHCNFEWETQARALLKLLGGKP